MNPNKFNPYLYNIHFNEDNRSYKCSIIAYSCRMFYMVRGTTTIEIDGRKIIMKKYDMIIIPPKQAYYIRSRYNAKMITVQFDFEWQENVDPAASGRDNDCAYDPSRVTHMPDVSIVYPYLYIENFSEMYSPIIEIINEYMMQKSYFRESCSAKLKELLVTILREAESPSFKTTSLAMSMIMDYIGKNYAMPISSKEIAEKLSYHPNYINRIVKNHTGLSFSNYVLNYRLNVASSFLSTTKLFVGEVAAKCGFSSHAYFSRVFKAKYNMSPEEYRRKNERHFSEKIL